MTIVDDTDQKPDISALDAQPAARLFHAGDAGGQPVVPVRLAVGPGAFDALPSVAGAFARAQGFDPASGKILLLPDAEGGLGCVLVGAGKHAPGKHTSDKHTSDTHTSDTHPPDPFLAGRLPDALPDGCYELVDWPGDHALHALAFLLATTRYSRLLPARPRDLALVLPDTIDIVGLTRIADAVAMGRELVNRPANQLGCDALAAHVHALAASCSATCVETAGDDLLTTNFPMIHAVGRASAQKPRIMDLTWGDETNPKVTLVGKGVVFDTGGLDIKPSAGMLLMKKDMGGAASAMACARMIMQAGLPVRLRLIVPIVENAIAGNAFRPGDILPSRTGLTVEIGNTDAEGRLILGDALALADEDAPELLVDFATLTGAARVALGPDLPPFYTQDEALAADLARLATAVNDPVWRLPMWQPYATMIESKVADINNAGASPFAGSITAALFLSRVVERAKAHVHFDVYGWTPAGKPGRPEGGEVQAARLIHALVTERYGHCEKSMEK